jgi:hypothetical protein
VVDEVDAFGDRVHQGSVYVDPLRHFAVGLERQNGGLVLQTIWYKPGVRDASVPAGSAVRLAFSQSTLVELETAAEAAPIAGSTEHHSYTQWKLSSVIDPEMLERLSGQPLMAMKTDIGGETLTLELTKKNQADVLDLSLCMASPAPHP